MNGIGVQPHVYGPQPPPRPLPEVQKSKHRYTAESHSLQENQMPQYNAGEWIGSPCRQFVEVYGKEVLAAAKKKTLVWLLAHIHNEQQQTVSSWTGFNMQVHSKDNIVQTQIV